MDRIGIAAVLAAVATVIDLRTGRIPNGVTIGGLAAALVYRMWVSGVSGGADAVLAAGLGAIVLLPFMALGGLGGGDVKLLAAVGAWVGVPQILSVAVATAVSGGVIGLAVAAAHGCVASSAANLGRLLAYWRTHGVRPMPGLTIDDAPSPRLAYAGAIFAGVLVAPWVPLWPG